jgi:hypothetical protein
MRFILINLIKFFHLVFALSLLGSVIFCFGALYTRSTLTFFSRLNKSMLILAPLAMITGSLLVYPKHFTFHTPWIQAAYALVTVFCVSIFMLSFFKNIINKRWMLQMVYLGLIVILVLVVHDAVTKTTFLFS